MKKLFIPTLFIFLFFLNQAFAWNTPQINRTGASYTAWTWIGAIDSDWTNGNNWCGAYLNGVCQKQAGGPPATALVVLSNACSANCNPILPAGTVTIGGLHMDANYTGTLNIGSTNLVIGAGGFTHIAGTFQKGSGTLTIASGSLAVNWRMSGGTFIGGSGDITLGSSNSLCNFSVSGTSTFTSTSGNMQLIVAYATINATTTFNHGGGTITFSVSVSDPTYSLNSKVLNHVVFNRCTVCTADRDITIAQSFSMDGDLTIDNSNTNYFHFVDATNISLTQGNFYHIGGSIYGRTNITFTGSGLQLVDNSAGSSPNIPKITAQQTMGGQLRFIGTSGNLTTIHGGFLAAATLGSVDLNGVNFTLNGSSTYQIYINSGAVIFPSLTLAATPASVNITMLKVAGDLAITSTSTSQNTSAAADGRIEVGGDVNMTGNFAANTGKTILVLNGAGAQVMNLTGSGSGLLPNFRIEKTSGSVTFSGTAPNFTANLIDASSGTTITMPAIVNLRMVNSGVTHTITSGAMVFNEFHFTGSASPSLNFTDNMTINGDLYFDNTLAGAASLFGSGAATYVNVKGGLKSSASGVGWLGGSAIVRLNNSSSQSVSFSNTNMNLPNLEIASTGGTVTVANAFKITNSFTYTSGTVDATTSSLTFANTGTSTITSNSSFEFNDVIVTGNNYSVSGTAVIKGNLTLSALNLTASLSNGTIDAYKDVSFTGNGFLGSTSIIFKGSSSTLTRASGANLVTSALTSSKTAGQVLSLGSNLTLSSGQNFSVTSGQVDLATRNMTLQGAGALTLSAATTVKLSAGVLTVGGSSVPAGAYSGGTIIP